MSKYYLVTCGQAKLQFSLVLVERANTLVWLIHLLLPSVRCATLTWDGV